MFNFSIIILVISCSGLPPSICFLSITNEISFSLQKEDKVAIRIYDSKGQYINSIYNGSLRSGWHEFEWNGGNYPSGVYFLKIESSYGFNTQKVLLLK